MNFTEATNTLFTGYKVRRTGWGFSKEAYIHLEDYKGIFTACLHEPDFGIYPEEYTFDWNDIVALDWEIV